MLLLIGGFRNDEMSSFLEMDHREGIMLTSSCTGLRDFIKILVGCSLPPSGWTKPNTDGATKGNPGVAGGGGLLHDSTSVWHLGFARNVGFCTFVITFVQWWMRLLGLGFGG